MLVVRLVDEALSPGLVESLELGGAEASDTVLLVGPEPGLLGVTEDAPRQKVHNQADDDEDKGDGVQVLDGVAKDVDTDDGAPEVARQQADIKEGGGAHSQDEGRKAVEDEQSKSVADNVADGGTVPSGLLEGVAVKDGGGGTANEHADEAHEGQDLVHGPLGDVPLLKDVAQTVARSARQPEQVTLELVLGRVGAGARHGVGGEQHAHATAGDEDAEDLEGSVAHLEQQEAHNDDADDGPEVEELGAEEVGVAVGQDGKVISLDVEKAQDEIAPAVLVADTQDLAPAIAVEHVRDVDKGEQDVVEEGLEGGDRGVVVVEKRGEDRGGGVAEAEELAEGDDEPKVPGGEVGVPAEVLVLEFGQALGDDFVLVGVGIVVVGIADHVGAAGVDVCFYGGGGRGGGVSVVAIVFEGFVGACLGGGGGGAVRHDEVSTKVRS